MTTISLLHELEPVAARLLDRHLETTTDWMPHELVPWSRGRDFDPERPWSPADRDESLGAVPDAVASALFVNLLTEDNLPYYFRDVQRMFGKDGAWANWSRRWTAEEQRHGMVIRDYLHVTRAIDPVELERARMIQVSGGEVPEPPSAAEGLVYLALQELATRISHRQTGKLLEDRAGYQVMARVAGDENLHHLFYRDLTSAALEVDPSAMVIAMEEVVRTFAMPGTGIPGFDHHAALIARAGIYDLAAHHDQILVPVVLRQWRLLELEGLTPEADQARASLVARIERTGKVGRRLAERRSEPVPA